MSIHVEIVTPSEVAYEGDCEMASAPGLLGEFGVLDMHAQTLAVTTAGVVTMAQGGSTAKLSASSWNEAQQEQPTIDV